MRIAEAAKAVGCTQRAIKFYEEKGLLSPVARSENGYRDYTEEDVRLLHEIHPFAAPRKRGRSAFFLQPLHYKVWVTWRVR